MSVMEAMRASRLLGDRLSKRRQPRHAGRPLYADLPHPDETVTEALESMAPVLPAGVPDGARPAEDIPAMPSFTPRPTGPQPLLGTRPARRIRKTAPARPVSRVERDVLERVRDGLEHMDGTPPQGIHPLGAPPFGVPPRTETDRIRQDAAGAPARSQRGIRPLPPEQQPKAAPQIRERHVVAAQARMENLSYPAPDGASHALDYAELMRRVSLITGTRSRFEKAAAWGAVAITAGAAA